MGDCRRGKGGASGRLGKAACLVGVHCNTATCLAGVCLAGVQRRRRQLRGRVPPRCAQNPPKNEAFSVLEDF